MFTTLRLSALCVIKKQNYLKSQNQLRHTKVKSDIFFLSIKRKNLTRQGSTVFKFSASISNFGFRFVVIDQRIYSHIGTTGVGFLGRMRVRLGSRRRSKTKMKYETKYLFMLSRFLQIRKPLVEKRRRDRMNNSLTQLKSLLAVTVKHSVSSCLSFRIFARLSTKHEQHGDQIYQNQHCGIRRSTWALTYSLCAQCLRVLQANS